MAASFCMSLHSLAVEEEEEKGRGYLLPLLPSSLSLLLANCGRVLGRQDAHLHHHLQPGLGRRERGDSGRRGLEDGAPGADRDLPGHDGALRVLQLLCPAEEVGGQSAAIRLPFLSHISVSPFDLLTVSPKVAHRRVPPGGGPQHDLAGGQQAGDHHHQWWRQDAGAAGAGHHRAAGRGRGDDQVIKEMLLSLFDFFHFGGNTSWIRS